MSEILDNLEIIVDGDANTATVEGEITHFSSAIIDADIFGTGIISGVPDMPIDPGDTFKVILDLRISSKAGPLSEPKYFDNSQKPVAPIQDLSNGVLFSNVSSPVSFIFTINFITYSCDPAGIGTYISRIEVQLFPGAGPFSGIVTYQFQRKVNCSGISPPPTDGPGTAPPTTPSPTPTPSGPDPEECVFSACEDEGCCELEDCQGFLACEPTPRP